MCGDVPDVIERILHSCNPIAIRLVGRRHLRTGACVDCAPVQAIYIVDVQEERCRHRLHLAVRLAHFNHRVPELDPGMLNDAVRRLRPEDLFCPKGPLQEVDHSRRSARMQTRRCFEALRACDR